MLISGIALNHKHDWNPNYIIEDRGFTTEVNITQESHHQGNCSWQSSKRIYREIWNTRPGISRPGDILTIFIEGGSVRINTKTGERQLLRRISKRPLFYQVNFLHYNPGRWWKYFSDIFCVALILVTVTGLLLVKGKNGITRRGAVLTAIGIILPLLFLFIY
ncbi:MAG: PepSY-associated TM helix domain-containing protein [Rhodopseudomonas palustris]|nr:PepSY-associated TM helix domain-containing protein [Rhodopseudomonas palustris]